MSDITAAVIRATAKALHRFRHPSFPNDYTRCKCPDDAAWAVEVTQETK